MKKILVLHGVNLNMFGKRDPAQYGTVTLDEINRKLEALGKELGCTVEAFQTNDEGAICGKIHDAYRQRVDAVLINAGAWTHYSYALRDALAIAPLAKGQIVGFGLQSYLLGLRAAVALLDEA
jgi:3-dehydroquinate dehydratase-2